MPSPRTLLLTRAGVLDAFAQRGIRPAPSPLPNLPDDTPPSVALKAVKATGRPEARYTRHVGAQQITRAQRQAASRQRKLGCPDCGVVEADVHRPKCPSWMAAAPAGPLCCEHCGVRTNVLTGVSRTATGYDSLCSVCAYHGVRA